MWSPILTRQGTRGGQRMSLAHANALAMPGRSPEELPEHTLLEQKTKKNEKKTKINENKLKKTKINGIFQEKIL